MSRSARIDASGPPARYSLFAFRDLEANLREQVRRVVESPLLLPGIPVTGYVYEVETGKLRPVASASTGAATVERAPASIR